MDSLVTERLTLKPFTAREMVAAFAYFRDAEVMRYISGGPDQKIEDTAKRLARYALHQANYGFSKWAVFDKATNKLIGDAGFMLLEEGPAFELGYRFVKPMWGKGFATEVARAWLSAARTELKLKEPVAFAHPDHQSSIHVLEKIGMRFKDRRRCYGMDVVFYTAPPV